MGIMLGNTSYIACDKCKAKSEKVKDIIKLVNELEKTGWYRDNIREFWLCPNCRTFGVKHKDLPIVLEALKSAWAHIVGNNPDPAILREIESAIKILKVEEAI
jgi:hypothetical protein